MMATKFEHCKLNQAAKLINSTVKEIYVLQLYVLTLKRIKEHQDETNFNRESGLPTSRLGIKKRLRYVP